MDEQNNQLAPRAPRGLAATTWGPGRLDLFWVDDDRVLWHSASIDGVWAEPESLGGELDPASTPAASSSGPDRLDVYGRGVDGRVWHRWWDGTRWVPWEQQ